MADTRSNHERIPEVDINLISNMPTKNQISRRGFQARHSIGGAPSIQISMPNIAEHKRGIDNPVFTVEEADSYTLSRPVSSLSQESALDNNTYMRRGSYDAHQRTRQSLSVPGPVADRRRGSSVSTSLSLEDADLHIPGDGEVDIKPRVDYLAPYTPRSAPRSPGGASIWSELVRLDRSDSIGSYQSEPEGDTEPNSSTYLSGNTTGMSSAMSERIRDLIRRFSIRTERVKERTIQPPTPSSESIGTKSAMSGASDGEPQKPGRQHRLDSFVPVTSAASGQDPDNKIEVYVGFGRCRFKLPSFIGKLRFPDALDPTSRLYICWLMLVTFAFVYNCMAIPLRAAFYTAPFAEKEEHIYFENETICVGDNSTTEPPLLATEAPANELCWNQTVRHVDMRVRYYLGYETNENRMYWWLLDYSFDLVYLLDILVFKSRVRFIQRGMMVTDKKELRKHYMASEQFKFDVCSLIPLDLLYFVPFLKYSSLLRMPRYLKVHTFWEFWDRMDQMVTSSHIVRVLRTLTYMLFLIHLEACGYYSVSAMEGLGINEWVYDGKDTAYIKCIYLATKTATSIGNNPRPENTLEYLFMTFYWLSGVFVFAMLIGQIRDIFQSANMAKETYRKTMDQTLAYMKSLNLPGGLQDRVRMWFNYNWEHSKTLDENSLLEALPRKMKADLAIHVHFNTLSKVQLFQDCDKNLLFDLVLKLKPVLYLPMDYICRKGEVGVEMYIVNLGQVEVVGGPDNGVVFATLHEGSVFGEISLLALSGCNRRTADVRSKGFSQLFILSKVDFEEAMEEYPVAYKILKKRAKRLLAQNAKKSAAPEVEAEEVIQSRHGTPMLLKTVVKVMSEGSHIHDYLGTRRRSSRAVAGSPPQSGHPQPQETMNEVVEEFEDEILIVEQTERPLSHNSAAAHQRAGEFSLQVGGATYPGVVVRPATEDLPRSTSPSSLTSDINSIMDTPSADPVQASTIPRTPSPSTRSQWSIGTDVSITIETQVITLTTSDDTKWEPDTPASVTTAPSASPLVATTNSIVCIDEVQKAVPTDPKSPRVLPSIKAKSNKVGPDKTEREDGKLQKNKDGANRRPISSSGVKKSSTKINRVAPANADPKQPSSMTDLSASPGAVSDISASIPSENLVTCSVEVHRAKTPTGERGVDNPAFVVSSVENEI